AFGEAWAIGGKLGDPLVGIISFSSDRCPTGENLTWHFSDQKSLKNDDLLKVFCLEDILDSTKPNNSGEIQLIQVVQPETENGTFNYRSLDPDQSLFQDQVDQLRQSINVSSNYLPPLVMLEEHTRTVNPVEDMETADSIKLYVFSSRDTGSLNKQGKLENLRIDTYEVPSPASFDEAHLEPETKLNKRMTPLPQLLTIGRNQNQNISKIKHLKKVTLISNNNNLLFTETVSVNSMSNNSLLKTNSMSNLQQYLYQIPFV
ncbi:uncharacterized protein LOC111716354, partial [Eurytemora carolleeae]|uniref:uncharacterized protein LOC111716354 n=1 Tax=Eurytemora carolleeae TaxID=1294199 RepID=UPI000C7698C8